MKPGPAFELVRAARTLGVAPAVLLAMEESEAKATMELAWKAREERQRRIWNHLASMQTEGGKLSVEQLQTAVMIEDL